MLKSVQAANGSGVPEQSAAPVAISADAPVGGDASGPDREARLSLFFGPLGLRAGWGIAFYLVIAFILAALLGGLVGVVTAAQQGQTRTVPLTAHFVALNDGVLLLAAVGSTVLLAHVERRRLAVYGLGRRHMADLLPGLFTGLLLLSLLVALLHALHLVVFERRLLGGMPAVRSGLAWLFAFLLVGAFEEYFFRGYLQYTLTRGLLQLHAGRPNARPIAFGLAAVLLSLFFCAVHGSNNGETAFGLLSVFVAGAVFSYALWRTGSLWWAVGFHASWDWGQSFLFGVPDSGALSAGRLFATHPMGNPLWSGGAAGPEGSLLVLPVLLLVPLLLLRVRARAQPRLEPEDAAGASGSFLHLH